MKKQLRFAMTIVVTASLNGLAMAQCEVKPLTIGKKLQQKIENAAVKKEGELLGTIIKSGVDYFRKNTGVLFDSGSANMGNNIIMNGQQFDTDLFWPGSDDRSISVRRILKNNNIVQETYSVQFSFTPDNDIASAEKMFSDVFESVNGSLVVYAGSKLMLINQPFIAVIKDATGRHRSHIEFEQFYKATKVKAVLEFYTENTFFNIELTFSKVRMNNRD